MLVAAGVDAVTGEYQEGEGALYHVQCRLDRYDSGFLAVLGVLPYEVGEYFAVGGGLEEAAVVLEIPAELRGVHEVAVVGEGEVAGVVVEEEGLHVLYGAGSGRT